MRRSAAGAAAISQVALFNDHPTGKVLKEERLHALMGDGGIHECGFAQNCVESCPKEIPLTRSISRVADVSLNTVYKTLIDAGKACWAYHDEHVRGVKATRIQCDEIWAFCYSKQKNVAAAKAAPVGAGDIWTWTALEASRIGWIDR